MTRLAALLLLSSTGTAATAVVGSEAEVNALVQTNYQVSHSKLQQLGSTLQGRYTVLSQLEAEEKPKKFNCSKFPDFCREPFNCHKHYDTVPLQNVATKDGHARFNTWCANTAYYPYMTTCVQQKNLVKAAQIQYDWTVKQPGGVNEMDGSYCFIEGHCSNTAVTNETTVEEGEKMCDFRYGHDGWAKWSALKEPRAILSMTLFGKRTASATTGFHDPKITRLFLKMACGMGNYHCDVMYCKETYCKNPYYVNKYSHLLPKTPGHLLKQINSPP